MGGHALAPRRPAPAGVRSAGPAILSKFEVGLLAAGLQVPRTPFLGSTTLPADPSVGDIAYAVLRRQLGSMLAHEAGTRLGEDIEELHDMRVATRRLRAALHPVRRCAAGGRTPAARRARLDRRRAGDGARSRRPAGTARSLARRVSRRGRQRPGRADPPSRPGHDDARQTLLAGLDSERYERLVFEFGSVLLGRARAGTRPSGRRARGHRRPLSSPGSSWAGTARAANAARKAKRSGIPADYHRLRIRCKRLRYALEFVSEIYDGKKARPFVKQVVALQDCLGLMQDGQVAAVRLQTLATAESSSLSPAAVFAMGAVAERYRREAARLLETVPGHLSAVKGRRWRKLKALMERRRVEAGDPETWSSGPPAAAAAPTGDARLDRYGTSSAFPPATGAPSHPAAAAAADDDREWDEEYAPSLRSVPLVPDETDDADEPAFLDAPRTPTPPPVADPPGGRRRKEPVFLPAPPAAGRPGPVWPVPDREAPEDDRGRSFRDRP